VQVLVLSLYDLGRPPLEAFSVAEHLRSISLDTDPIHTTVVDLAIEDWPTELVESTDVVVFSVPMHTAARLTVDASARIRSNHSPVQLAAIGLYAHLAGSSLDNAVNASFGPHELDAFTKWICELRVGASKLPHLNLAHHNLTPTMPQYASLDWYAQLAIGDERRVAGALSASTGCLHRCTHCPVPVAFDGRIRLATLESVLSAADAQVAAGASHLSFADPDFLNAPSHARRIVRTLKDKHPTVTFDCTVKVEHILRHVDIWPAFASAGCLFVVSALESVDNDVLRILDKGHTAEEGEQAVKILRSAGIEIRPSLLPFTPWTTVRGIAELFAFAERCDLLDSIDPVQFSIRLLVPHGSLLAEHPAMLPYRGSYDDAAMTYRWSAADPKVDALQLQLAAIAEAGASTDGPSRQTYARMRYEVAASLPSDEARSIFADTIAFGSTKARPRMTEPWFC
jgi:hypothetical protein